MTLLSLMLLGLALTAVQIAVRPRVRRELQLRSMMRPAELWDAEDVDHWLELIEPFPLEKAQEPRS